MSTIQRTKYILETSKHVYNQDTSTYEPRWIWEDRIHYSLLNLLNKNTNDVEGLANELFTDFKLNKGKRYRFYPIREHLFRKLFKSSFESQPEDHISRMELLEGKKHYPHWKEVCWIKTPQLIGEIFRNIGFRILVGIGFAFVTYRIYDIAYNIIMPPILARGLPLVINYTPIQIIQMGNKLLDCKEWILKNKFRITKYVYLIKFGLANTREIPYITSLFKRISYWSLFKFSLFGWQEETNSGFRWSIAIDAGVYFSGLSQSIGQSFNSFANRAKQKRLSIYKKEALKIWLSTINPPSIEGEPGTSASHERAS